MNLEVGERWPLTTLITNQAWQKMCGRSLNHGTISYRSKVISTVGLVAALKSGMDDWTS